MQTKNNQSAAAQVLAGFTAGHYEVSDATAKLLDCIRAGNAYYDMILDALRACYADVLSDEEADAKEQQYLAHIVDIVDMLHAEISGSIVDALNVPTEKTDIKL